MTINYASARATISTDLGNIELRFFNDLAPGHVKNFCDLAQKGFYNGLIFHRIIEGFMIQGGCPNGTGMGGPGYNIDAEFNKTPHKRGILSMARASDPNSAGSQFFIVHQDSNFLDNQYTAFGEVTSGMEVVDQIVSAPKGAKDRPVTPVKMNSVVISS